MSLLLGGLGPGGGGCGCCGTVVALSCCLPCAIPKVDLTFTVKFYSYNTGGFPWTSTLLSTKTVTLAYNNLGGTFLDTWTGSVLCPDGVSRTATIYCSQFLTGDPYGTVYGSFPRTTTPFTLTAAGPFLSTKTASPGIDDGFKTYSCSPFAFHSEGFSDDGNGFLVVATSYYDISDPSGGTYTGTCCPSTITVLGCGGLGVPGASYAVWTDSGKLSPVASGTTDSSGNFGPFDAGFCGNAMYREITHPRFVAVAGGYTYVGASGDNLVTPAAGYHCSTVCGTPVANTLHATHPVFGAITYSYSAGSWVGTKSYSYPGNVGGSTCAAKTVTITCTWDGGTGYTESWKYDGSNCPDDAGGNTATVTWTAGTLACPMSFSYAFTHTPSGAAETSLYGLAATTNTLTE